MRSIHLRSARRPGATMNPAMPHTASAPERGARRRPPAENRERNESDGGPEQLAKPAHEGEGEPGGSPEAEGGEHRDVARLLRSQTARNEEGGEPHARPEGIDDGGKSEGHRESQQPEDAVGLEDPEHPAREVPADREREPARLPAIELGERSLDPLERRGAIRPADTAQPPEQPSGPTPDSPYLDRDEAGRAQALEGEQPLHPLQEVGAGGQDRPRDRDAEQQEERLPDRDGGLGDHQ